MNIFLSLDIPWVYFYFFQLKKKKKRSSEVLKVNNKIMTVGKENNENKTAIN